MALLKLSAMSSLAAALVMGSLAPATLAQGDAPMPNPPTFPDENPPLLNQDVLGKFLFWEEQVSVDNTISCGTCHITEAGGSDPRVFDAGSTAPGLDGILKRNIVHADEQSRRRHKIVLGFRPGQPIDEGSSRRTAFASDQVLRGKAFQGFANSGAGNTEPLGKLGFARQTFFACQPPFQDRIANGIGNLDRKPFFLNRIEFDCQDVPRLPVDQSLDNLDCGSGRVNRKKLNVRQLNV